MAVDPKVIPLGTKLYVKSLDGRPDYGFASAEDTGGAIKNKIDLYFNPRGREKIRQAERAGLYPGIKGQGTVLCPFLLTVTGCLASVKGLK